MRLRDGPARTLLSKKGRSAPLVLIVEDDEDQREMYATYLASQGLHVRTAADGINAVMVARESRPDIIIMDLGLPRVDGWQATRHLKQDPKTSHIPVIACTAQILRGAVVDAIDAGCDGYITKPCPPEDLLVEINRILAKYQGLERREA